MTRISASSVGFHAAVSSEFHTFTLIMSVSMNCSFGSPDSCCGSFGKNSSIVPLMKCDEDMSLHFLSLGISSKRGVDSGGKVSEVDVILNRFGVVERDPAEMTICPKHRRELTLDWPGRKSTTCSHPSHRGKRRQMRNVRRINALMSKEIFVFHQVSVPIGSGKCLIISLSNIVLRKPTMCGLVNK